MTKGMPRPTDTDPTPDWDCPSGGEAAGAVGEPFDDLIGDPIRNVHDVLANWWRRGIIHHLQTRADGATSTVGAITRALVARRDDAGAADGTVVERTRRLLRAHVLELDAFGAVEYEPASDAVRIADGFTASVRPP
jgi:hypothetical protein